ncbi:hypothetical protein A8990_12146 [Paenibacillus taihuensis]|uniref:Uncharacterized protein n=1 Tax=Paenibacillus taihuensis TaxID=1156355 RepID=A0A3D9RKC2_9BACL|nr:hypothetical protein A8990_12146 [Paenibacillus taihuensis]
MWISQLKNGANFVLRDPNEVSQLGGLAKLFRLKC